jgi:hypothetical protein
VLFEFGIFLLHMYVNAELHLRIMRHAC